MIFRPKSDNFAIFLFVILSILFSGVIPSCSKAPHHHYRGIEHFQAGDYEKAISELTKSIELDPDYAGTYYNRGVAYSKVGQYDQSIADFNTAIGIAPQNPGLYNSRGFTFESMGQHGRAISDYNKAI